MTQFAKMWNDRPDRGYDVLIFPLSSGLQNFNLPLVPTTPSCCPKERQFAQDCSSFLGLDDYVLEAQETGGRFISFETKGAKCGLPKRSSPDNLAGDFLYIFIPLCLADTGAALMVEVVRIIVPGMIPGKDFMLRLGKRGRRTVVDFYGFNSLDAKADFITQFGRIFASPLLSASQAAKGVTDPRSGVDSTTDYREVPEMLSITSASLLHRDQALDHFGSETPTSRRHPISKRDIDSCARKSVVDSGDQQAQNLEHALEFTDLLMNGVTGHRQLTRKRPRNPTSDRSEQANNALNTPFRLPKRPKEATSQIPTTKTNDLQSIALIATSSTILSNSSSISAQLLSIAGADTPADQHGAILGEGKSSSSAEQNSISIYWKVGSCAGTPKDPGYLLDSENELPGGGDLDDPFSWYFETDNAAGLRQGHAQAPPNSPTLAHNDFVSQVSLNATSHYSGEMNPFSGERTDLPTIVSGSGDLNVESCCHSIEADYSISAPIVVSAIGTDYVTNEVDQPLGGIFEVEVRLYLSFSPIIAHCTLLEVDQGSGGEENDGSISHCIDSDWRTDHVSWYFETDTGITGSGLGKGRMATGSGLPSSSESAEFETETELEVSKAGYDWNVVGVRMSEVNGCGKSLAASALGKGVMETASGYPSSSNDDGFERESELSKAGYRLGEVGVTYSLSEQKHVGFGKGKGKGTRLPVKNEWLGYISGSCSSESDAASPTSSTEMDMGGFNDTETSEASKSKDSDNENEEQALKFIKKALRKGGPLIENYNIAEVLGHGSYGAVIGATRYADGMEVAVKIIYKLHGVRDKEIGVLKQLPQHPNIVKFLEAWDDSIAHYAVMERCAHQWVQRTRTVEMLKVRGQGTTWNLMLDTMNTGTLFYCESCLLHSSRNLWHIQQRRCFADFRLDFLSA
ncbi:hypothetical protein HDU93_004897 [Gonapodya sp. JEL0774]|nr:hypothetical protein HDU93_004897 [Gonapodya sp. JEL0774]